MIIDKDTSLNSLVLTMIASHLAGNSLELYWGADVFFDVREGILLDIAEILDVTFSGEIELEILPFENYRMVRVFDQVTARKIQAKIADKNINVQVEAKEAMYEPELEFAIHMQEQSVTRTYHRYGDGLWPEDAEIIERL
jgi:hypothetical protein